jgi:hypothetical protein
MTDSAGVLVGRRRHPARSSSEWAFTAVACGACIAVGAAVSVGAAPYVGAASLIVAAFAIALPDWRRSILLMLVYLPVSGIPTIVLYPHTSPGVLAKDALFVVPAYVAFVADVAVRRFDWRVPGAPGILILLFTGVVAAQTAFPDLTSRYAALIGAKVWLLYIPMIVLGFFLIDSTDELFRTLKLMTLVSTVPLAIGLIEAGFVFVGDVDRVYAFYGSAARSVTQGFTVFDYGGGGTLSRIPSTFSFVSQYYEYAMTSICISYAWWRGRLVRTRWSNAGRLLWLGTIMATLLSGAREAFLDVPLLVIGMLVLDVGLPTFVSARLLVPVVAGVLAVIVIGASPDSLVHHTWLTIKAEYNSIIADGFHQALNHTWAGLGAGVDTVGTRYAGSSAVLSALRAPWSEGWYVKAILELGLAGFVVLVALMVVLVGGAARRHLLIHSSELRPVSAALVAFLVWAATASLKGPVIDLDPVNVYFWLFAGVLLKVAMLERGARPNVMESEAA